jgi:hypothetical protein
MPAAARFPAYIQPPRITNVKLGHSKSHHAGAVAVAVAAASVEAQAAGDTHNIASSDRRKHRVSSLKNMTMDELVEWCESVGEARSRALHLWRWMYGDNNWIRAFDDTKGRQNGFSRAFLDLVANMDDEVTCSGGLHLQEVHTAADGTRKLLFATDSPDDLGLVETVMIPVVREQVFYNSCMPQGLCQWHFAPIVSFKVIRAGVC